MEKKRGRKSKYDTHVRPRLEDIKKWREDMTESQIAKTLGISYSAWNQYKVEHEDLAEALKEGQKNLVADLRSALIKKALGYQYTETKKTTEHIKWTKEMRQQLLKAGITEEQLDEVRVIKTEISHKKMAPDVAALNLALKNYDSENWANDPQMMDIRKKELELREKQIENSQW